MHVPVIWAWNGYRFGHSFMLPTKRRTHTVLVHRFRFLKIFKFFSYFWVTQCANDSLLITVWVSKDPGWLWGDLILTPDISLFIKHVGETCYGIAVNKVLNLCKVSSARNSDELNIVLIRSFEFCDRRCFSSALSSIRGPKPHSGGNAVEFRNRNKWAINCLYLIWDGWQRSTCLYTCVVTHRVAATEKCNRYCDEWK